MGSMTVARLGERERWKVGGCGEVAWINSATRPGLTVISAIPPTYSRYTTITVPDDTARSTRSDTALLDILSTHAPAQPWWLGYLDTGAADVVFPEAPRVII